MTPERITEVFASTMKESIASRANADLTDLMCNCVGSAVSTAFAVWIEANKNYRGDAAVHAILNAICETATGLRMNMIGDIGEERANSIIVDMMHQAMFEAIAATRANTVHVGDATTHLNSGLIEKATVL